jgi:hypothetical protein
MMSASTGRATAPAWSGTAATAAIAGLPTAPSARRCGGLPAGFRGSELVDPQHEFLDLG